MIKFVILVIPFMSILIFGISKFIQDCVEDFIEKNSNKNYDEKKIYKIYIISDGMIRVVIKSILPISYIGMLSLMIIFAEENFQKQYFAFVVLVICSNIILVFLSYNYEGKYIDEQHKFLLSVIYAIYYSINMFVIQLYYQTLCDNQVYIYIVGEVFSFFRVYNIQCILLLLVLIGFPKEDITLFFLSNLISIAIYLTIDETFGILVHVLIVVIKLIYIIIGKNIKVDFLNKLVQLSFTYAFYLNLQFYIFEKKYEGGYFLKICKNYYIENNDLIKDLIVILITGIITLFLNNLKEKESS